LSVEPNPRQSGTEAIRTQTVHKMPHWNLSSVKQYHGGEKPSIAYFPLS
jgi:hypothetical protein